MQMNNETVNTGPHLQQECPASKQPRAILVGLKVVQAAAIWSKVPPLLPPMHTLISHCPAHAVPPPTPQQTKTKLQCCAAPQAVLWHAIPSEGAESPESKPGAPSCCYSQNNREATVADWLLLLLHTLLLPYQTPESWWPRSHVSSPHTSASE